MTGPIMSMLNSTGYCHLGPGVFYVSGNINMPANSTLIGCGNKTKVILLDSVSSGYIVQPKGMCTIKDIYFLGGSSAPSNILEEDSTNLGSRHCIYMVANVDSSKTSYSYTTEHYNVIDNCQIDWFNGSAIYMNNTGGSSRGIVSATNINIVQCMVGINIDFYSEYNKFTNIITNRCNIACINNGGNNVFTGCTFHGVQGFIINNSDGTKSNNAHGSCVGCTFNHIDNGNHPETLGNGYAIKVINTVAGFIFNDCQIWYGKLYVDRSKGVQFTGCEIGGYPAIETYGSYKVFFMSCLFQDQPTKSLSSPVQFDNCYTYNGNTVSA